jgi:hypothetical protein
MPNLLAYAVLLLWIPLGIALFARFDPRVSAVVCLIGGMLLLPAGVSFATPLVPLGKGTISELCVVVGSLLFARRRLFAPHPGFALELLVAILVLSAFVTGAFNRDVLFSGPVVVKGMDLHDDINLALQLFVDWGIPFLLGLRLFRAPADLKIPLTVLVVGALAYIPLILYELKMSPQLHNLVYGFYPHDFQQTLRFGGWRPVVFVGYGLALAFFLSTAVAAAMTLSGARLRVSSYRAGPIGVVLLVVLLLCKSAAALIYGVAATIMIFLLKPRTQLRIATALAAIVIAYPLLRSRDLFPTQILVAWADSASTDRAESLGFRFENEDLLLARAKERPFFGWGSWGRGRVRDTETGRDIAVTDGLWVIVLGTDGIVGFLSVFVLLLGPVFWAANRISRIRSTRDQYLIAGTALIVTFASIDCIPNVTYQFSFFLAGALAGAVGGAQVNVRRPAGAQRRFPMVENPIAKSRQPETSAGALGAGLRPANPKGGSW